MRLLLDTDICVHLLRAGSALALARFRELPADDIGISTITLAELSFGAAKAARTAHHQTLLVQFCAPLVVASFDDRAAAVYGGVRAALERAGTPIGPLDTLIASHALSLGLTLVTSNEREFRRVDGLRVENWLTA